MENIELFLKKGSFSKLKFILPISIIVIISYFVSIFTWIKQVDSLLMIAIISPALVLNEIFYTHQIKGEDSIKSKIFLKNIESLKWFWLILPFLLLFLIYKYFLIHGFLLTTIFLISVWFLQSFYYYYLLQYIKNELLIFILFLIPLLLFTKIAI